jgi:hypothetical protein
MTGKLDSCNIPPVTFMSVATNEDQDGIVLTLEADFGSVKQTITIFLRSEQALDYANALADAGHILQIGKQGRITLPMTSLSMAIDQERDGIVLTVHTNSNYEQVFLHRKPALHCANVLLHAVCTLIPNTPKERRPTIH